MLSGFLNPEKIFSRFGSGGWFYAAGYRCGLGAKKDMETCRGGTGLGEFDADGRRPLLPPRLSRGRDDPAGGRLCSPGPGNRSRASFKLQKNKNNSKLIPK
jgi:hypothetical protein